MAKVTGQVAPSSVTTCLVRTTAGGFDGGCEPDGTGGCVGLSPPAVSGWLRSEAFTTLLTIGLLVVESKFGPKTVKPDCVSETSALPLVSAASDRMKALAPEMTVPTAALEPPLPDGNTGASM